MTDALYHEIRRKMDSGDDRFSVVLPANDDGNTILDVNHMVLDDGMVWTYDNSKPQTDGAGRRQLSFIRQNAVRDEDDE